MMDVQTYTLVLDLYSKYGPGVFGKIAQKLLALSFKEVGYDHIVERSVEGVDIDAAGTGYENLAIEVKTSVGDFFSLSKSNVDALRYRVTDGYSPAIAALKISLLGKWIIAKIPIAHIKPTQVLIDGLRAYRQRELEGLIDCAFGNIVMEHCEGTKRGGLSYLSTQLQRKGIDVRES